MKDWFTWYEGGADDAESNLEFAYRAMIVVFAIAMLYWGVTL